MPRAYLLASAGDASVALWPPDRLRSLVRQLGSLTLLPLRCPLCRSAPAGRPGACAGCVAELAATADRGGASAATGFVALGPYDGPAGRAVRALKYGGARRLARPLGVALAAAIRARGWCPQAVCAVPTQRDRAARRGFDHAALLAAATARALGVPCLPLLDRRPGRAPQTGLDRAGRIANAATTYRARLRAPTEVALVDDVVTTGATAAACRRALVANGARTVWVVAVAVSGRAPQIVLGSDGGEETDQDP